MKLSYNWLKEFLPKLKNPRELGEILSMKVAEVEDISETGKEFANVVVAKILNVRLHPQADKLRIALVDVGRKKMEIVCGAPNVKPGQKAPLALPGARLANGLEIKTAVIRGVESGGMLCAEDELGLGSDHQGIMILDNKAKTGQAFREYLDLDDYIFEIENKSLTHRPDLFNHVGFCREIAVIMGLKIRQGKTTKRKGTGKSFLKIRITDQDLCPRYTAALMEGVKVMPSPDWLQNRLKNLGINPINNIVDITNYVLLEMGQPLHAFDADSLKGGITVRRAKKNEKIVALDDKEYELSEQDLVIADDRGPIALAGIIGGRDSAITQKTRRIVIEAANFDAVNVRRTSWRLGLRTEAVIRFEKDLPLIFTEQGRQRAVELVESLAKGKLMEKLYDLKSRKAEEILKQGKKIVFDPVRAGNFIGQKITAATMKKILRNLGMEIKGNEKQWQVIIPPYRRDVEIFEDLVEEIVRIYGSEKIIPRPMKGELRPFRQKPELVLERKMKSVLVGLGFSELYNYAFDSSGMVEGKKHLIVENPLNREQACLRTTLLPLLLEKAEKNFNYYSHFRIFEVGHIFYQNRGDYQEEKKLGGVIVFPGKEESEFHHLEQEPVFLAMGVLEVFSRNLNLEIKYGKADDDFLKNSLNGRWFDPNGSYRIEAQGEVIGILGKLDPVRTKYRLDHDLTIMFEINLGAVAKLDFKEREFKSISCYPEVKRDLSFIMDKKDLDWFAISDDIRRIDNLIKMVGFSELVEGEYFGGNKRNLCFSVTYQSLERTLKAEEVNVIEKKIIDMMEKNHKAKLRDF